jgi:phosphatidylserine decarboxylase
MKVPIANEGYRVIATLFVAALLVPLLPGLGWTRWPLLALAVFSITFFRDPERVLPQGENIILCPADGEVVKIDLVEEPVFFKGPARQIAIFMSPFNCHINRAPVTGQITYLKYSPGRFEMAFRDKASELNEQNTLGIENERVKVLVRQIAGFLARRIICRAKLSDRLSIGDRFGLIQIGSRVDVFLPPEVEVRVKVHDDVKGGLTILGTLPGGAECRS